MAKKKIPAVRKSELKRFVDGEDSNRGKWYNKSYSEKNYKGRSISMSDEFYEEVKAFFDGHRELGSVSQMTVRALYEFMKNYTADK